MAIQTLHDRGIDITPKMDGGVYATGISDCICKGIGNEFTVQNVSSASHTIRFSAGSQCVIGGAFFRTMDDEDITLQSNTTSYVCANIDLSKPDGEKGAFVIRTASNMASQNLNGTGTSRDLLLYVITTNGNGVTNVSDRRVIKGDGGASIGELNMTNLTTVSNGAVPVSVLTYPPSSNYTSGGRKIVYLTSNPQTKYDGYIYLIKES